MLMLTEQHMSTWPLRNWKEIPKGISCVYRISHENSNLPYFGRSKDLRDRSRKHFQEFVKGKHSNPKMLNIFNKYGDAFSISILVIGTVDYCKDIEGKLLKSYKLGDLLNCHQNSEGGSTNQVWTDEQRRRHSEILTGRVILEESKIKAKETRKQSVAWAKHQAWMKTPEAIQQRCALAATPKVRAKALATRLANGHPLVPNSWKELNKIKVDKARENLFAALDWAVETGSTRDEAIKKFNSSWGSLKKFQPEWEEIYGELCIPKRASGDRNGQVIRAKQLKEQQCHT